jgi:hypothetical protein
MKEYEYRFLMDSYTESLRDISDMYAGARYRTIIDGNEYCLSEGAYSEYMTYRDSGRQQSVFLAGVTGIPYALVYDAVCRQRDFAGVMDKIYVKSLFEEMVNAAVRKALEVVPDAFSQVKRLTDGTRTLEVGDGLFSDDTGQVLYTDKSIYVTAVKEKNHTADGYSLDMDKGKITRQELYNGRSKSDMYTAVIYDCLKRYNLKPDPSMLSRTAKIMGLTYFSDMKKTADKVMGKGR